MESSSTVQNINTKAKSFVAPCMHEYYAPHCDKCDKQTAQWVYSTEHDDGKKFCSSFCMEQYYHALQPKIKPQPKEEIKPEKKENQTTSQPPEKSANSGKNDSNYNWTPLIIGFIVIILVISIIGATISWLFKGKGGKN